MTREHLYRDDVGAAIERIVQLEDENEKLTRELDQLTSALPKRTGRRSIAPYLMLVTMTLAMLSSLAASHGDAQSPERGERARAVPASASAELSSPCRP